MGCNCGGKRVQTLSPQQNIVNQSNGSNQALIKQIQQQQQQAAIQQVIQQSVNPSKTLIKTYR